VRWKNPFAATQVRRSVIELQLDASEFGIERNIDALYLNAHYSFRLWISKN